MSFTFKTYPQILDAVISHIKAGSPLTDVNRGSVVRTFAEALSLQDADQYVQISKILNTFSIDLASGSDLDNRAADYGLTRLAPTQSNGLLVIGDNRVTTKISSALQSSILAGATSLTVATADFPNFPSAGTIILDRDGPGTREAVPYTSKTGPQTLNLGAGTAFAHSTGATVILSQQGTDHPISLGTVAFAPSTPSVSQLNFDTQSAVTLEDGDVSVSVGAISEGTGSIQNVQINAITAFVTPPWPQATVKNTAPFGSGRDLETDQAFRSRIKAYIQSLSRATDTAIQQAALAVVLPSGQRVVSAQVVEPIIPGQPVYLYIDDGSGLTIAPNTFNFNTPYTTGTGENIVGFQFIVGHALAGQRRFNIGTFPIADGTLSLYSTPANQTLQGLVGSFAANVFTVTDVNGNPLAMTPNAYVGYFFVDANNRLYRITANAASTITVAATAVGQPAPVTIAGTNWSLIGLPFSGGPTVTPLAETTNYNLNPTTGDFELSAVTFSGPPLGLEQSQSLAMAAPVAVGYSYIGYEGLIQQVQKVINGVPSDLIDFPGYKAAGVIVIVAAPQTQLVPIIIQISSALGVDPTTLFIPVQNAVITYINSLGIGDEVVVAEIIASAMSVSGVADAVLITPTANIPILLGQLARTNASLVQVV